MPFRLLNTLSKPAWFSLVAWVDEKKGTQAGLKPVFQIQSVTDYTMMAHGWSGIIT